MSENNRPSLWELLCKFFVLGAGICALCFSLSVLLNQAVATGGTARAAKNLPIYCVDTSANAIALTFDAAWGNEDTAEILEILEKHDIRVTFFMTGDWVSAYPEDVKAILAAGHTLGNHSDNHFDMASLSVTEIQAELQNVHNAVYELTGYEMYLFRPPYGSYNDTLIDTARDCGYYTIQWDVDSLDWKDYGIDSIINTVCDHSHLGNGSIILCHNGATYTADALDEMITHLKNDGYTFVTVDELIYKDNYYMDFEGRQHKNS